MEIVVVAFTVWLVLAVLAVRFIQNSAKLRRVEVEATQEDYLSVWAEVLR